MKERVTDSIISRLGLLVSLSLMTSLALATTYSGTTNNMFDTILNSNSSEACTQCHHSTLSGPSRHAAPSGANFDSYTATSARATTLESYVRTGYMPMDPGAADFTDAANLNATEISRTTDWYNDGAPLDEATAQTNSETILSQTSVRLNGTIDTNTLNSPGTFNGEHWFEWRQGTSGSFTTVATTTRNLTTSTNPIYTLGSLVCGTTYQYRVRAQNGHNTATGATENINITCTPPQIYESGVPAGTSTSKSVNEGSFTTFQFTRVDDDAGTLTWSIQSAPGKGTANFNTASTTTASTATVRYTPSGNNIGSDSFIVRVTNGTTLQTDNITVNMTINDDGADAPVISVSPSSFTLNEDNSASADASTSAATVSGALSLSATDPDNSPTYHWDVTATNDGTPNFTVSTGASPTLQYTPLQNSSGSSADSFTIRVCDGGSAGSGNCDTQVVTVNLTAQPDTPIANADPSMSVSQGGTADLNVTLNDSDPDLPSDTLTPINIASVSPNLTSATVVGNNIRVTHDGSATPSTASLQYTVQDSTGRSNGPVTVTIAITGVNFPPTANSTSQNVDEGTSFDFNLAGSATYSSDPEGDTLSISSLSATTSVNSTVTDIGGGMARYTHNGTNIAPGGETDSFTFQVDDSNVGNGPSNTGTITINLQPVNDEPVAVNDAFSVDEGGVFDMTVSDTLDTGPNNTSLFDNDTDEENGAGTGMSLGSNASPARSIAFSVNASGLVSYTHDGGETTADSFTYIVNDGSVDSAASATVNITINPVNDQPAISSSAPSATFTEDAASAFSYDVNATDVDIVNGNDTLSYSITSGQTGDMSINPSSGLINWTPQRTGVFNDASKSVTVRVTDNDESTSGSNILFAEQIFSITTTPPDGDSDGIPDYVDNCLGVPNADQADLDGDTRDLGGSVLITSATPSSLAGYPNLDVDHTSRDPSNALSESYLRGGDACDEDADGDGISKAFEDSVAYLSDGDAADALLDEDGDGLLNGEEFLAGTDPAVDTVGPSITAPADITVDATGYLTVIDVGQATAVDGNEGAVLSVIPAVNPDPVIDISTMDCSILGNFPAEVAPFRPGRHIITWITCDSSGNLARSMDQTIIVRPLVSVSSGQNIGEGQTAVVEVSLNGTAPAYPVQINYTVGGLSDPNNDHDAADGIISIPSGQTSSLSINVASDSQVEFSESIIINLDSADNAAISTANTHTINIVEANVAPEVDIGVVQGSQTMGSVIYISSTSPNLTGNVVLTADTYDANDPSGSGLTYTWTDAGIGTAVTDTLTINPAALSAGVYPVTVEVSDGELISTASIKLVAVAAEPSLTGIDSDGDGTDDATEGAGDADRDGIPNYLDDASLPANVLQNQTSAATATVFLETELGLRIATGTTSRVTARNGAVVTGADIASFGGPAGGLGSIDEGFTLQGSYFDFEISGLKATQTSVNVVIPLPIAMLPDAQYRKFDGASWHSFVVDSQNTIWSAPGEPGVCPAPGSAQYIQGLTAFHYCVQLTIQDGGPNDADGLRDFVVRDPGGVSVSNADTTTVAAADDRLGVLSPLTLVVLLPIALLVWSSRRR